MADPLSLRTRRAVDARIVALREQFGSFPVVDATRATGPEFFERGVDLFDSGVRGTAGARVSDDQGRLLLVRDGRDPETWVLPAVDTNLERRSPRPPSARSGRRRASTAR